MEFIIKNCNNIKEGNINVEENKLNIKYGINGTGKSTLSKAISLSVDGQSIEILKPFGTDDTITPSISGIENIKSIKIYNEEYINKYLFLPDNVYLNSFEVFIKPENYDTQINDINSMLNSVKDFVVKNNLLQQINIQKEEIFKILKPNNQYNNIKSTGLGKALNDGNKIKIVPDELKDFSVFINSTNKVDWYKWHKQGSPYINSELCPFCAKKLDNNFNDINTQLENIFDSKNVENIIKGKNIIYELNGVMCAEKLELLNEIFEKSTPIIEDDKKIIIDFLKEIELISDIYNELLSINYSNLNNLDNLTDKLNKYLIDTSQLNYINSNEIISSIDTLNTLINNLLENVVELKKKISILNSSVSSYTSKNKKRINDFLKTVGMNYFVDVVDNKVILFYIDSKIIVDVNSHLSWGEKNSFALALFLFDCLHSKPDLIILDDPVSSFDSNKKYAIIHYLFKKDALANKTVLLFTHDLEPIIDMLKVKEHKFVSCTYVQNINGKLNETFVSKSDIDSIINVSKRNYCNGDINIVYRIIHLRRYLELNDDYDYEYNMISSLLKGKPIPTYKGKNFTENEYIQTEDKIKKYIGDFNYKEIYEVISQKAILKDMYSKSNNNYEKIEIFRIMLKSCGLPNVDEVYEKFIDEEFHIENSYVFQLDPYAYNIVPDYIINVCNHIVSRI